MGEKIQAMRLWNAFVDYIIIFIVTRTLKSPPDR